MRRVVPLSHLTTGRCFTLAEPPVDPPEDELDQHKRFRTGLSILQADMVWKVALAEDDGVGVDSAFGEHAVMAATTPVVEVPRQGYDRLVQRVKEAGNP